ncbi:hypothetical protein DOY81_012049 [Sarcophaga bullata]|nr:hypothetical protein DOY81_012049 [Sarcophaga bullata]
MLSINDNTDNIAEITNDMVVPLVNEILKDKTISIYWVWPVAVVVTLPKRYPVFHQPITLTM